MKFFQPIIAACAFAVTANALAAFRANTPAARLDAWWTARHAEKIAALSDSSVKKDIVFIGDELTQGWETTGAASLASHFTGDKTMFNLGFAGDCTENVLWRIQNGELGSPKAIFLMVGGNNAAIYTEKEEPVGKTYLGVRAIIDYLVANYSSSKIVVQAVLPRGLDESDPVRPRNDRLNIDVRAYVQKKGCSWVDMSDLFLESDHHALKSSLFNADHVTLNASGYEVWAQAVAPYVNAAASGSAMSADLVATARPVIDCIAAFPTATNAVMQDAYWRKFDDDVKLIGENGRSLDLVLLGDSLTQKWMEGNSASSMSGLANSVLNLGRTGDFVENLHWRLAGGCIDGYTTKFFNLLIGTNNTIQKSPSDTPEDIAAGVRAVLDLVLEKHPESKVLLMPIIPYGYTNAQNSAKGAAHYANNQAANEIIRTFADGQRVILVDVRSQFMNADGTYKGEMYLQGNGDYPDMFLHLTTKAYEEILAPAIKNAMATAGASSVTLPAIGDATAQVSGTSATIALSGVTKGTDANGTAASSYSVFAKLDTDAEATVLSTQTGATASFTFPCVSDGWHSCAVWVSSDGKVKSQVKRVKFLVDSHADAIGWKVAPMDATGSAFRSDGTLVFARGFTGHTVNGVSFSSGFPSADQATVSPSSYTGSGWTENNPVFNGGWVWEKSTTSQDIIFTVKGLTAGKKYLVQILAANHWNNSSTTISAGDLVPLEATKQNDYKCGAVITRIFEATSAQEGITINFATTGSKCLVKAIQLRELGEGSGESGGGESGGGESGGGESGGGESGGGELEGEDLTGEFVKKTFIASNKLHLPYRVAAKANPNGGKVPVVVFLHGYGQCGVDNSFTINEMTNIKSYLDSTGSDGYKLLVPQCPNDVKWAEFSMNSTTCTFQDKPSSALAAVFDLLDAYAAMADVDANRIYVTGLSMGGHGTWDAICRRPDFFAAAMPCCGGGDPVCAADIAHVPVLAVHNRGDPTIPVEQTEGIVTALRALGSDVIFEKLENNSHDAWTTCYSRTDDVTAGAPNHRFVWMFAQNRATNNRPKYPRITELTAAPSVSSATISLAGVVLGTDANSVPATKYSVAYKLDGAANAVTALSDQTADSSFTLEGLADGNHTCEVTMTTDKGRTKTKSVVFYVNTSAVSDVWTSAVMDASGNSFSTEGTFVYGYVCNGGTVNGIPFERSINLQSSENPPKISFTPNIDGFTGDFMNEGVSGNFGLSLGNGWYWETDKSGTHTVTLTLSNLEGGKKYLVQFLAHNFWDNSTTVSANGSDPVHIHGDKEENGKYGALVTGVFTATGATKDVTITFLGTSSRMPFNAVQVREIPDGGSGGGDEPDPVVPDPVPTCSLTIPAKTGIVLQSVTTNGVAVVAVAGSYTIVSNTQVTVNFAAADGYEIVSGNPVVFTLAGNKTFADGDYPIVQQTSGGGGGDEPGPVPQVGWTVGPMSSDGSTIRTDGTLLYAYSSPGGTVGGVPFARAVSLGDASMVSASPASAGNSGGSFGDGGATGDFGNMLRDGWYWTGEEVPLSFTLTLSGLTAGHSYLVQLVSHRTSNSTTVSANGSTPVYIHGTHEGVDYTYGGSLVGVFTAAGPTADVTVTYPTGTGNRPLNAIQVRDLGESSGGGESGGGETVEPIVPGPDTTNTLHLAKIAEYPFGANGCGGITYSGEGGLFYVLQDHDDNDGYAKIYPLTLGVNAATGAIESQVLGAAVTPAGCRNSEGLARDPLSGALWISDEWEPPSISEFSLDGTATGRTAPVPSVQREKVRSNLSLESLTISPDGLTMWTANEQALTCDGESSSGNTTVSTLVRLTRYTRTTAQDGWRAAGEWAYACDPCAGTTSAQSGLSGLCALPDGSLLALEREVSTATWGRCRIYRITTGALAAATEVSGVSALTNAQFSAVEKGTSLVEIKGTDKDNMIVYEGIALGPQLSDGSYGVYLVSDGGATTTKTVFGITVTATTVSRICALKLTGLGGSGAASEADAPVIGGEGVEVPFAVSSDKVSITIGNAAAGHRYGYRKSVTLAGLKDAPVVYFENPASADGVLTLEVPKAENEPSCFYQIVVE